MNVMEFAAKRAKRLVTADDEMRVFVRRGLDDFEGAWYSDIVEAASVLWLETFEEIAPDAFSDNGLAEFQKLLRDSLKMTSNPGEPASDAAVERVTTWVGTLTVNDATYHANRAAGNRSMRWVTMHDDAVRDTHAHADGQRRSVNGTFNIGGFGLRYPGEPVGPPEIWIQCRCLLAPGKVNPMSASVTAAGGIAPAVTDPDEEDIIDAASDEKPAPVEGEEPTEDDDLVDDAVDEIPVHGVLAPEGVPTGDGRQFGIGSLTNRELPLPARYEFVGTHGGTTSDVATVGRIDEIWKVPTETGNEMRFRGVLLANRAFTEEVIAGIADGSTRGISVEVDNVELDIDTTMASYAETEGTGKIPVETVAAARIAGFTIVPIGAYQEAYIALGAAFEDELTEDDQAALAACGCATGVLDDDDFSVVNLIDLTTLSEEDRDAYFDMTPEEQDAFIAERGLSVTLESLMASGAYAPGTKDGPGWITNPKATSRIRRYWTHGKGAAKIKWGVPGDFNRCRRELAKYVKNPEFLAGTCANMHKEALGVWPGQEAGGRKRHALIAAGGLPEPMFRLAPDEIDEEGFVASGSVYDGMKAEWFMNPNFTERTPMTITADGRIYGHLATWTTCHIGITGVCTAAPHSPSDYAFFHTGRITTDQGDVRVGNLTHGIGHASLRMRAAAATAHYDKTSSVFAHVAMGEDAIGIWYSGVVKPGVSQSTLDEIKAIGAISGDWRYPEGQLELVGVVSVATPGLPVRTQLAATHGIQTALIASAGFVPPSSEEVTQILSAADIAGIARAAVAEFVDITARRERVASKATPAREKIKAFRAERARRAVALAAAKHTTEEN